MSDPTPRMAGLTTASPPHNLRQEDVARAGRSLFAGRLSDTDRMFAVYGNAGIDQRQSCVPLSWYLEEHSFSERNELFLTHAVDLMAKATDRSLSLCGLDFGDIDMLVAVSTSGIATPGLEARLMQERPFRRNVERLPLFGLGCAGGVLGLARAAAMAKARPGAKVQFLCVELCGLTFRHNDHSNSNFVATALFGDGAAAAVLSTDIEGPVITHWGEHCWPDSLDVMGWKVGDDGLGVLFSRDIPTLVRRDMRGTTAAFLSSVGLDFDDIDCLLCHPGGAKVLDALEEVFGMPPGGMIYARNVLRRHGNMSAVTVLFVLAEALCQEPRGRWLLTSLGPGFTAGFLTLETEVMWLYGTLAFVVVQRLAELMLARRNTRRLLAQGAVEVGAGHYPLIVMFHAAWLLALLIWIAPDTTPDLPLLFFFALLQAARIWILLTLGPRWTTRIIVLTGAPLVKDGPYRWFRHPNYIVVAAEIAVLPLAFGAPWLAICFSALNGLLLWYRIRVENRALGRA